MIVRQAKYFSNQIEKIKKRYPNIEVDVLEEVSRFNQGKVIALGHNLFKVKVKNSDIPCGKSGGYRVIIFHEKIKNTVIPLIVYSKRARENVSKKEIILSLKEVLREIKESNSTSP